MSDSIIEKDEIGRCIGEGTTTYVSFVTKKMPCIGDYVIIEFDDKEVLGLITKLARGNPAITGDIFDPETVSRIKYYEGDDFYIHGLVRILGDIKKLEIPRTPPPPGTIIKKAKNEILREIFQTKAHEGITIGHLISNPDVPVEINVNKMVSRHLAILAITGAGKSNAVTIIVDELLKLGGCVLIFDMHSEYANTEFTNGLVNVIPTKLNPIYLSLREQLILLNISSSAFIQERYIRKAHSEVKEKMEKDGLLTSFLEAIKTKLEEFNADNNISRSDRNSITGALNKVEDMILKYSYLLNDQVKNILDEINIGVVNVIDLGLVGEELADVIVSHVLRNILQQRKEYKTEKKGFAYPIFTIIEEAHVLSPIDRNTLSKYWISRIAREGRKFGIGLCLVSQRPKVIDPNALSQANNLIILKLVEPGDQRHVQNASETLSDDLMNQLPSLNTGEAILLGMMTKVPALVKINEFAGKKIGQDIDIVKEWSKAIKNKEKKKNQMKKEVKDIYGGSD